MASPRTKHLVRFERRPRAGFALLITITLLAFLVILLVGLAAYTRVETAVASNTQRQSQARQNALLALNVALAQLQKHAGPDTRVTATGQGIGGASAKNLTGVWDATGTGPTALTWLVSGSETTGITPDAVLAAAPTPATTATTDQEFLVREKTVSNSADYVKVAKQNLLSVGVPGQTGAVRIGRYAWWIGDQGVKAPVAVPDASDTVTYAPFDSADLRSRIRQQITLGAGAADAAGAPVFEPRDVNNAALVANQKIASTTQIAFLKNASNAVVGLANVQRNFINWSPGNFAVLANTKTGGLREDLSLAPAALGDAFAAWANYPAYMESFGPAAVPPSDDAGSTPTAVPVAPAISPPYGSDPLRRRYRLTPPHISAGVVHSVAPVMSFFGLSFSVRENADDADERKMEVAVRCVVTLWNPYSSALVPEDLRVEISGLPEIQVEDSAGGDHPVNLQETLAGGDAPLRFYLPWTSAATAIDQHSWLPGRVYSWAATENFSEPTEGNPMVFHFPDATPTGAGQGVVRPTTVHHHLNPVGTTDPVTRFCRSLAPATIRIRVVRVSDGSELGTYSLNVEQFGPTTPMNIAYKYVDFAIVRRLPETDELAAGSVEKWLTAPGRDPRHPAFPATGFIGGPYGEDPALYGGDNITGFVVRSSQRLLDRAGTAYSSNEDVPVFELPRAPILSVGQLQHLHLADARPFAVGNPWSSGAEINGIPAPDLFDRFFFSGLSDGVTPTTTTSGDLILPNPLLKPLRKSDATRVTIEDVRALMSPATGTDADGNVVPGLPASAYSSKYFLQGAAFNLNSKNATAWTAVLRGVRFPAPQSFGYLNASADTGTADDADQSTVQSTEAQFFRFSQSAQETYSAQTGLADSGADTASPSLANTHLFRRGMRTLTAAQIVSFSAKIVELMAVKHAAEGPFRSLAEFLAPSALFSGVDADGNALAPRSLLEAAITDTGLNAEIAEFSSQWLTQADIMTALAPVLFPRSDTFVIRAFGEAVNPVTNGTEGKAWCEAIVQRVPEYYDPAVASGDAPEVAPAALVSLLNQTNGRRFKIISFRWLTRSDI